MALSLAGKQRTWLIAVLVIPAAIYLFYFYTGAREGREAGRAELAALARTVLAWKESYIRLEYQDAAIDFMEEIDNLVYPYLKRLFECGYIDETQFRLFLNFCDQQMNEISKSGKEVF